MIYSKNVAGGYGGYQVHHILKLGFKNTGRKNVGH